MNMQSVDAQSKTKHCLFRNYWDIWRLCYITVEMLPLNCNANLHPVLPQLTVGQHSELLNNCLCALGLDIAQSI